MDNLDVIHVEIVRGCQLRCVGCPISTLQPKVESMTVDNFQRCLDNIPARRVGIFYLFNYGEPLLHPDVPGLLDAIAQKHWKVNNVEISTNGQKVDPRQLEDIMKTGVLTQLYVSCDGDGTPKMYEELRPPGKWEKLIKFFNIAAEMRDRYQPNLRLITRSCVREKSDCDTWKSVVEPLGWTTEFRHWFPLVDSKRELTVINIPGKGTCRFVNRKKLYVDMDGMVIPCCAHPGAAFWGDLKTIPLPEIFSGEERGVFVRTLQNDRKSLSVCGRCEWGKDTNPDIAPTIDVNI